MKILLTLAIPIVSFTIGYLGAPLLSSQSPNCDPSKGQCFKMLNRGDRSALAVSSTGVAQVTMNGQVLQPGTDWHIEAGSIMVVVTKPAAKPGVPEDFQVVYGSPAQTVVVATGTPVAAAAKPASRKWLGIWKKNGSK